MKLRLEKRERGGGVARVGIFYFALQRVKTAEAVILELE